MENFSWKISKHDVSIPWVPISILSIVFFGISAYLIFSENYFASAFFFISPIVLFLASVHGPKEFYSKIETNCITVNNSSYLYDELSYFSFIADNLVIKPKGKSAIYILFNVIDKEKIRKNLLEKLKEKEHDESWIEIISRLLNIQ